MPKLRANRKLTTSVVLEAESAWKDSAGISPKDSELWLAIAHSLDATNCVPKEALQSWFGASLDEIPASVMAVLSQYVARRVLTPESVGREFEIWGAMRRGLAQKNAGVYFTPPDLAAWIASVALHEQLAQTNPTSALALRICDPAAGSGSFLIPAVRILVEHIRACCTKEADTAKALRCVYGIDADPLAVALIRVLLCLEAETGPGTDAYTIVERNIVCGDSLLGGIPFADKSRSNGSPWESTFPEVHAAGGFDVVLGNPPWGTIKPAQREFVADHGSSGRYLHGHALTTHIAESESDLSIAWASHRQNIVDYAATLKNECGYRLQGTGDADLYRYFLERAIDLTAPKGTLAFIVPSAISRAEGARFMRNALLTSGTVEILYDFVNTARVFDIHPMFRFSVLIWRKGAQQGIQSARFGLRSVEEAREQRKPVRMSLGFLREVSGSRLSVPDVRSSQETKLFRKLHRSARPLGERQGDWNVKFRREIDMTNDSRHFVNIHDAQQQGAVLNLDTGQWVHPDLGLLMPVIEGRMVHQFDSMAKAYVSGAGRSAQWSALAGTEKRVAPQFLISNEAPPLKGTGHQTRAGFCDVTGHANERSVLASVIDGPAACGNKVPTVEFDSDDPDLPYIWVAIANSFVIDWLVRRRVSTSMNFFVWEQIPFPRITPDSMIGREVASLARQVISLNSTESHIDRAIARARIDALVGHQFELSTEDFALIFDDFPLLDRRNHSQAGKDVTRDLVLSALDDLNTVKDGVVKLDTQTGPRHFSTRLTQAAESHDYAFMASERAVREREIGSGRIIRIPDTLAPKNLV